MTTEYHPGILSEYGKRLLCLAVCFILAACAYPVRNLPAAQLSHIPGTVLVPDGETLIIVTASGGGTRATALASSSDAPAAFSSAVPMLVRRSA